MTTGPVIQIDRRYLKDDDSEAKEVGERLSATIAAVGCATGVPLQLRLPPAGGNQGYAAASSVTFTKRLGHVAA